MASYLKFFGSDDSREPRTYSIQAEIQRAESHCVAGFSENRKPIVFHKDDIIFMGRMVKEPNDYIIFGRGIVACEFQLTRDHATLEDIKRCPFREKWPFYLRLADTIFINGSLHNGVAIESLIEKFSCNSFTRTRQWFENDKRNFSIRTAFANQSYVELTNEASGWLNEVFKSRLEKFGRVDEAFLKMLPRPEKVF